MSGADRQRLAGYMSAVLTASGRTDEQEEHARGDHENGLAILSCSDCHDAGYHEDWDDQTPIPCPLCLCEDEGHAFAVEDIADGVVGGGAAHVYRIYCTRCGEEGEPEDLDA
jgi:hypothetical protein